MAINVLKWVGIHAILCTLDSCPDPLFLKLHHLVGESSSLISNDVALWYDNIFKEELCCIRAEISNLVNLLSNRYTLGLLRNTDEGLVPVGIALTGVGKEADPVRLDSIGDPHFTAIDHKIISTYIMLIFYQV